MRKGWRAWKKPPGYHEPRPLRATPLDEAWQEAQRSATILEDNLEAYFGIDFYTSALGQPEEDVFV
jgi:hypothetical protein